MVHSASVLLEAYVSFAINSSNGVPLANGRIIQIIGSPDGSISGFGTMGGGTNISNIAIDDEIIIGTVDINSADLGSNGTFYSADFTFDSDIYTHVYLRAFDSVNPLEGLLNWSFSDIFQTTNNFGFASVDFGGAFNTTNRNSFAQVPEPGTGTILLFCTGLLFWLRLSLRRPKKKLGDAETEVAESSTVKEDWL